MRSAVSHETIKVLAAFLHEESESVKIEAEHALRKHEYFYSLIPCLEPRCLKFLYRYWMERSYRVQLSLYLQDDTLYVNAPEGLRVVRFESREQQDTFRRAIKEAQVALRVPSHLHIRQQSEDRESSFLG